MRNRTPFFQKTIGIGLLQATCLLFVFKSTVSQVHVLMNHNDLSRTGANLSETSLTASNVNTSKFGKLWSYPVSGQVYAQPLYVQGVNIPSVGIKNVLYVA